MREGLGGGQRVGMVERLEHQLAARTPVGRRAERPVAVEHRGGDAPIVDPSHDPPASTSSPATTSGRSGQWRPGGSHGRSIISSRLAPISTGQRWSGRRKITKVHIHARSAAAGQLWYRHTCSRHHSVWRAPCHFGRPRERVRGSVQARSGVQIQGHRQAQPAVGDLGGGAYGAAGDDAEAYVKDVVAAQFEPGGDKHVVDKVAGDLGGQGPTADPGAASASNSSTSRTRQNSS